MFSCPDAVEESNIAMFADVEVKSAADAVSLQSDLNRLDFWSKDSGLTFNDRMQGSENIKETDSNRVIVQQQRESSSFSGQRARLRECLSLTTSHGANKAWFEQSCRANKLLDVIQDSYVALMLSVRSISL